MSALVVLTTSFPIRGDGSEAAGSFVSDFAEALSQHVQVRVVAPGPQSVREMWTQGVEVFRYASPAKPLSTLKPWHPAEMRDTLRVLQQGMDSTRAAVKSGSTTHILALWALPCGYWARRASRATGVPYSVWALGSDIWSLGRIPGVRAVLRSVIRDATYRYADGLQLGREAARIADKPFEFLPSTRSLVGKRARALALSPPYSLLFLGRWHPNKGIDLLLDALTRLDDDSWSKIGIVHIAGGGALGDLVQEKVAALEAEGRPLRLSGFLNKEEAAQALSDADFLLIPSRIESIPVVFSDAMKFGLPVISMPVGDLSTLITRYGVGVLASHVDAKSFANALSHALNTSPVSFSSGMAECVALLTINTKRLSSQLGLESNAQLEGV